MFGTVLDHKHHTFARVLHVYCARRQLKSFGAYEQRDQNSEANIETQHGWMIGGVPRAPNDPVRIGSEFSRQRAAGQAAPPTGKAHHVGAQLVRCSTRRTTTGSPPTGRTHPRSKADRRAVEGGAVADGGLQYAWYVGRSWGVRLYSAGCSRARAASRAVAVGAASAEAACHSLVMSLVARAVERTRASVGP